MFIDRLEEAIKESTGQKKLELCLHEPTENITVEMFSRRYWVDPKVFIEKVKGMEFGGVYVVRLIFLCLGEIIT